MNDAASTKDWLGRTRRDEDEITLGAVQRLAATLDQDASIYRRGSEVPESWYAILFGPTAPQHEMGPDGHPQTGDFLPPLHGTRRMFAGRRTRFFKPLRIGDVVSRVSRVTRAESKTGKTGLFTLVTVTHEMSGPAGLALTEEQDLVYRAAVAAGTAAQQREAARSSDTSDWSRVIALDPVLVFRYSALTFNAHRIHYDLPYTRDIEGYPALVMNGGLTALLLVETARPHLRRAIAGYAARAMSPLFVGQRVTFNGRLAGDTAALWAAGPDGGPMRAPLAGIRVVDLTTVVVGPTATLYLAEYGADVIKVEAPGGDLLRTIGGKSNSGELSGKFMHFNRNKRSLALDLKQPRGRDALLRLLDTADVFIANVRRAALARLGLGADMLRERYKRLIVCNLMGFGRGGRYEDRPAYDTIIQGLAGVADCNRRAGGEPRYVPMVFADHVVGLIATQCIMAALFARERTGEGQAIEVPMFENMAAFVLAEHMGDLTFVPPRGGSGDVRVLDPMGKPVATKDGYICVSAKTDAQAFALFEAIGRPELKSDPRFSSVKARLAHVRDYFDVRATSFRTRTTDEWLAILAEADVPAGRMHTLDSLTEDAHLADVGFFREVEHPVEGRIVDMRFPNRFSAGAREDYRPPPRLGGDSVAILREIGYGSDEIDDMVRSEVTIDAGKA